MPLECSELFSMAPITRSNHCTEYRIPKNFDIGSANIRPMQQALITKFESLASETNSYWEAKWRLERFGVEAFQEILAEARKGIKSDRDDIVNLMAVIFNHGEEPLPPDKDLDMDVSRILDDCCLVPAARAATKSVASTSTLKITTESEASCCTAKPNIRQSRGSTSNEKAYISQSKSAMPLEVCQLFSKAPLPRAKHSTVGQVHGSMSKIKVTTESNASSSNAKANVSRSKYVKAKYKAVTVPWTAKRTYNGSAEGRYRVNATTKPRLISRGAAARARAEAAYDARAKAEANARAEAVFRARADARSQAALAARIRADAAYDARARAEPNAKAEAVFRAGSDARSKLVVAVRARSKVALNASAVAATRCRAEAAVTAKCEMATNATTERTVRPIAWAAARTARAEAEARVSRAQVAARASRWQQVRQGPWQKSVRLRLGRQQGWLGLRLKQGRPGLWCQGPGRKSVRQGPGSIVVQVLGQRLQMLTGPTYLMFLRLRTILGRPNRRFS